MAFAGILFKVFMKEFKVFLFIATLSPLLLVSVNGQINSPCTASMISSYTPCMNYITGSSRNGASPTVACCNILKNLMSTSVACTCLVLTANVPLLPINRTLALSLPRACHMDSLPMQCEGVDSSLIESFAASGAPLPAPGPVIFGPTPLTAGAPLSPRASKATALAPAPAPAPGPETTQQVTPASPTVQAEAPTTTAGIRPVLSPSASVLSCISPPSSTLILLAIIVIKSY